MFSSVMIGAITLPDSLLGLVLKGFRLLVESSFFIPATFCVLHPERFPEMDPGRAALRSVEDFVEQNDNSLDGIINNLPEPDPTERACRCADEKIRESVLEKLREQQKQEPAARQERPGIFRRPEERSLE